MGFLPSHAPFPYLECGERQWRAAPPFPFSHERERLEGLALPLFLPKGWPARERGAPAPCGLVYPSLRPLSPSLCRGCPEPLSVTLYVPGTLRNTSGFRIPSSYILIFTSRPFRDSSSCIDLIRDSEQHSVTKSHNSYNTKSSSKLSVRTLRVRELCRHDQDTSPVNNQ